MRAPPLDQLEELFLGQWNPDDPDKLRKSLAVVRDAILMGVSRACARAGIAERRRRRRPPPQRRKLTGPHALVLRRAAGAAGVDVEQLVSTDRSRTVSRARAEAMWALRHVHGLSYPEISAVLRRRDHTSALWCVRKVEAQVAKDPRLAAKLRGLAA